MNFTADPGTTPFTEATAVGNDRPYHYLGSGKTYFLKGIAFSDSVVDLMK